MATGDPQLTFPRDLSLQKLHLQFAKPRSSDTVVKITIKGNNGRKAECEKRFKLEKGTTLEKIECEIGGKPWTRAIENFRIDDSTTIQLRLTKAGSAFRIRDTRESSMVCWSHIKTANRTGDELVYEAEDSSLKATVRLQFQALSAEPRLALTEAGIQKAILSQEDREEITSKFKSISNTLNPIMEVLDKVSQIHPVASMVVGLVKIAHDRLLDGQIKYDEAVRTLLEDMTHIHPFARVASANQSSDIGLVNQSVAEMLNLMHDACNVLDYNRQQSAKAHLMALTAASREELVREFKRKLDNVIRNFNISLNAEIHTKVMTADQKAEAVEIKEWLTSLDAIKRFNSIISTHVSGTGSWFLEREDIQAWIRGESDTTRLFCTGIPGCGKTMMISLVCKTLLQRYQKCRNVAILRVYFDHKDPKTHSFDDILLSFTRQLIQQGQPTPEWIRRYYHEHTNFKDIDVLRIQLSAQLKSYYSTVFILADALDECPPNVRRKFLEFLELLSVSTRVFLTSRPGQGGIAEDSSFWITVDLQADSGDVLKYVEQRLVESDDPDMLKNHENLHTDIKRKVLSNADGIMLLAKLQMDAITEQNTVAGLKHVLENLPDGLDDMFEESIQRIKKQKPSDAKLAMKILLWIVGAKRPLSVRELKCAVALELTEPYFDEQAQPASNTMTRVCAGLVIIDGDEANDTEKYSFVRLVHLTVQEYFTRVKESFFDNMQVQLASLCLTYLLWVSRQGVDNSRVSILFWYDEDVPVFLRYCSAEWPRHASGCQLQVLDLVLEVLQNDVAVEYSFSAINPFRGELDGTALHLLAYHGLQEILNFILLAGKSAPLLAAEVAGMKLSKAVQNRNRKGRTPLSYAAGYGHLDVVRVLLENEEVAADDKDERGRTPLSYAARYAHLAVVKVLLEKEEVAADDKDERGRTPLSHAVESGRTDVVNALLAKDEVEVDGRDESGRTSLSYAAESGSIDVVRAFLAKDEVKVDGMDNRKRTPLSYAAKSGSVDVVNALLAKAEVEVDGRDQAGRTPLSYAAEYGRIDVVNALLVKDEVKVDGRDKRGRTPLLYAAEYGHLDVVNALLVKDEVEAARRDQAGRTPLSYAAEYGHLDVVNALLVKNEVDVDGRDKTGRTPLLYAAECGRVDVVNALLVKDEVKVNGRDKRGRTPLSYAAEHGHRGVVNALLVRKEVEVNGRDESRRTPLSYAAEHGHRGVVNALLMKKEVEVDGKDESGRTPLSYAAGSLSKDLELISTLLAQDGVEPDRKDNIGRTPLSYAAGDGSLEVVNAFLEREDVNADRIDNEGKSPLIHATKSYAQTSKTISSLLSRGADVNREDNDGGTPLSCAAECGDIEIVDVLLAQPRIEVSESTGRMLFIYAAKEGRLETVNALIGKVDVDMKDSEGRTALSHSAERGHIEVVNALLAQKIKINDKDEKGRSALVLAAEYGHLDVVIALLAQEEIEVDGRDKEGRTPLSLSAGYGHLDVLNCLLAREGVDGDLRDNRGKTPLSYAAKYGRTGCLKALLERENVAADSKDSEERTPLSYAAQNGHIDPVKELLMYKAVDLNSRDKYRKTPLTYAAGYGCLDVAEELLRRDEVKPDCIDKWQRTPLAYAAEYGHLHVVMTLLGLVEVEPDARDKWGMTPLMYAADNGHLDVLEILMPQDRVDVNGQDNRGRTALMYAAWSGHVPVVKTMIGQGEVDPTIRDEMGSTLLAYAASAREKTGEVVKLLLALDDGDTDAEDTTGRAPISYAAANGNIGAIKALLGQDSVEVDRRDIKSKTPLWRAAKFGHPDAVVILLAHGKVDADIKSHKGITPLSAAARFGHIDVIEALLATDGVDVNSQDDDGRTALSYAAEEGRKEVVSRLLLVEGIAVHLANKSGSPPILFAKLNGHSEISAILEERGAVAEMADAVEALFRYRDYGLTLSIR